MRVDVVVLLPLFFGRGEGVALFFFFSFLVFIETNPWTPSIATHSDGRILFDFLKSFIGGIFMVSIEIKMVVRLGRSRWFFLAAFMV